MTPRVYILGGYQTDFAQNWSRDGGSLYDILELTVRGALAATALDPKHIQTAHIANFVGELMRGQGHLGGILASLDPGFEGLPTARHEAADAAGSVAALAAAAEIQAGWHDVALVVGVEELKNLPGHDAARALGAAAWAGREAQEAEYPWPHLFSRLMEVYEARHGLDRKHLARIAQNNFANARRNPNAQTRGWKFEAKSFAEDDEHNPVIEGRVRKHDCGQITDGGAAVVLASPRFAQEYAARRGLTLENLPYLKGWGHRTAPMLLEDKLQASADQPYIFPHVRATFMDALQRAGMKDLYGLDGIEAHDCFTITEYMIIEHIGLTPPGEAWHAIEDGTIAPEGAVPVNPSGGLIGAGHPAGATGVRMLLDAYKQVTDTAGDYQVNGARDFATLNIGGSATTCVSFIVGH